MELEAEPAAARVRLSSSSAGTELVELGLASVRSLVVERKAGRELLGVLFDERLLLDGVWLRTTSALSLTRRAGVSGSTRPGAP